MPFSDVVPTNRTAATLRLRGTAGIRRRKVTDVPLRTAVRPRRTRPVVSRTRNPADRVHRAAHRSVTVAALPLSRAPTAGAATGAGTATGGRTGGAPGHSGCGSQPAGSPGFRQATSAERQLTVTPATHGCHAGSW